jgi:hypothetical protein
MSGPIANTAVAAAPYVGMPLASSQFGLAGDAATALTVPAGARYCVVTCESQAVRWRDDGTAPTASVGFPLAVGAVLTYSAKLSALKFISQIAGATLDVAYYA